MQDSVFSSEYSIGESATTPQPQKPSLPAETSTAPSPAPKVRESAKLTETYVDVKPAEYNVSKPRYDNLYAELLPDDDSEDDSEDDGDEESDEVAKG